MTIVRIFLTIAALISLPSLQVSYGGIICEKLPVEVCAFSVSSSGARCVLEKSILRDGSLQYECQSSDVIAENMNELIETEECMNACGVERMTVGLSTDTLEERDFTKNLCSPRCYNNCPNIIDLYYNLAAGEGSSSGKVPIGLTFLANWISLGKEESVYLPSLCETHRSGNRRMIGEFISPAVAPVAPIIFGNPPISPVMAPSPSISLNH